MSNLLVTYEGLPLPPKACSEAAPEPQPSPKGAKGSAATAPADGCSIVLPLGNTEKPQDASRSIRFDRQKDHFVLSSNNSADNLTWVGKQKNLGEILDILRVLEGTLRKAEVEAVEVYAMKLSIIQYLVTGRVLLHGSEEKQKKQERTQLDLAERMLEIFSISSDQGIANFIGPINVFRADAGLSEAVKDRIRYLNQILDLRPKYRSFREHFAKPEELQRWAEQRGETRQQYQSLLAFLRKTVINESMGKALRYDESFDASYQAFLALNPEVEAVKGRDTYCKALEGALTELRGGRGVAKELIAECRAAMEWSPHGEEEALRKSLRYAYLSEAARPLLEEAIEAESRKANMKVDWLADRGRFADAYRLFDAQLKILPPSQEGGAPRLSLKPSELKVQLNVWRGPQLTQKREYLLASLALLRRVFGESGAPPRPRVFYQGSFGNAEWALDAADLKEIRLYQQELEKELQVSQLRSDLWLPVAEGATCAAGLLGLGFSEGLSSLGSHPDLKLGLGATSAGLAGGGCSALIGHYAWPRLGKVRNRYLWEGLTGLGGAAVGVGIYFLARSIRGDGGNPQKFPVDEYGP